MGLGFGLILTLSLLVALLGLKRMSEIEGHLEDFAGDRLRKLNLVSQMRDALQTGSISAGHLVMLTDDEALAQESKHILEQRKIYEEASKKLANMANSDEEKSLLANMAEVRTKALPLLDRVMEYAMGRPVEAAQVLVYEANPS